MSQTNANIRRILQKWPDHAWLQAQLAELDREMTAIQADRNRLIRELSRARTEINRLRAGL